MRVASLVLVLLSWLDGSSADAQIVPPDIDPTPDVVHDDTSVLAITVEPRALYLTELRDGGGRHAGPELAVGLRIPFDRSWAVVLRARGALAFDLESPAGELSPVSCGGYYFYSCSGDTDMRFPIGGEAGLRFDDVTWIGGATQLVVGAELVVSGSAYFDSYEETQQRPGALGGAMALTLELLFGERWGLGLVGGGRLEVGLDAANAWAALHAGLRISRRF